MRTRFAPSPTGYMHVGNLRTALYAFLLAKKNNGSFILRIEDTDQDRQVEGATEIICDTLKEANLIWDEGPDIGGSYAPYIQSERKDDYIEQAKVLVANGSAYYCFCTKDELEKRSSNSEQSGVFRYDGYCSHLCEAEIALKLSSGTPFVIRQKMPKSGTTSFHDLVYGDITVDNSELEDQILIKSDGMPTYNFANVVDDHAMNITHIIRGNEYLSSSPKYTLLYQDFGWDIPSYIHCPPVMKDHQHKLSKRDGDASYQDLTEKGYLPSAILNYLALLGWAPKSEQEIFSLNELIEAFDISGISKSPAIFDIAKLNYINGEYIRKLSLDEFYSYALPFIKQAVKRQDIDFMTCCEVLQPRCEYFSDILQKLDFIDVLPEYTVDLYVNKKMKTTLETSLNALLEILPVLSEIDIYTKDNLHSVLFELINRLEIKNGMLLFPLRVALSGKQTTPGGGIELAVILGKEESLKRIKTAINMLENSIKTS